MAVCAPATTNGRIQWWLCARKPVNRPGDSNWCITTFGIMIQPRHRYSPRCATMGRVFQLSSRATRPASCMCSTARRARRCSLWKSAPCRRATCPAKSPLTQPFPVAPPPLVPHRVAADEAWGPTLADREACRNWFRELRNEGIFTPPSLQGTLVVPGNLGGMNWSGYAFDPEHGLLVANTNSLPAKVKLIPRTHFENDRRTEDGDYATQAGAPYGMFRRFIQSPSDLPCNTPPWGTLTAVDMAEGKIRWQIPFGSMQDFGGSHPPVPPG